MHYESKPLLILSSMAFTALIKSLKLERKSMILRTIKDRKRLAEIEQNISESEEMLEVIERELKDKHS